MFCATTLANFLTFLLSKARVSIHTTQKDTMTSHRVPDKSSSTPEHVPAPWTLKGDLYWLVLRLSSPLPPDVYHPLDAGQHSTVSNNFQGRIGMIQVIRYSESPVGPYDELMIIPGEFEVPGGEQKGKSKVRVSRIYVNQKETCYNGRRNWNIPKHLARFEFSEPARRKGDPSPKELKVSVYQPDTSAETAVEPFFSATFTPAKWLPSFPLSTKYFPLDPTLVQPPLPAGDEAFLAGTDTWKLCRLLIWTNSARLMWADVKDTKYGENKAWPNVKPWSLGVYLEDAVINLAKADEFSV